MADHLPGCFMLDESTVYDPGICICTRLKAAEHRGFHRGWRTAETYWRKVSIRYGRRKVQEARDAVQALMPDRVITAGGAGYAMSLKDALAAIDALRGNHE